MQTKLLDTYSVVGLLISIIAVWFSIYISPKEIPVQYIFIVIIGIGILGIIMILINKFSNMDNQLLKLNENSDYQNNKISELIKRFKTLEDLNNIRLNIKELQREVFKK